MSHEYTVEALGGTFTVSLHGPTEGAIASVSDFAVNGIPHRVDGWWEKGNRYHVEGDKEVATPRVYLKGHRVIARTDGSFHEAPTDKAFEKIDVALNEAILALLSGEGMAHEAELARLEIEIRSRRSVTDSKRGAAARLVAEAEALEAEIAVLAMELDTLTHSCDGMACAACEYEYQRGTPN